MSPTHSRQRAIRRDEAQKADYSFKKNLILRFLVKQNRQTFILISSFRTCRDLTRLISNRRCFIRKKVVCCFSTWKEINTFIPNVKCKINNLQSYWHMNVPAEEKPLGFNAPLSLWEFFFVLSFIAHCGTHAESIIRACVSPVLFLYVDGFMNKVCKDESCSNEWFWFKSENRTQPFLNINRRESN